MRLKGGKVLISKVFGMGDDVSISLSDEEIKAILEKGVRTLFHDDNGTSILIDLLPVSYDGGSLYYYGFTDSNSRSITIELDTIGKQLVFTAE